MSDNKNIDNPGEKEQSEVDSNLAVSRCDVASITSKSSINNSKLTAERQIKFERAQRCLENAALVSKRIKEHRKATAELLGRPYEDDNADNQSELASTMSEKTGYSVATDTSTTLSVQDALNIPGISESLANTLKQKEILMQRIKQYKEISKRPSKMTPLVKKELTHESSELRKSSDKEIYKLMNIVKDKENALSIVQDKMKAMETTILDMQEKLNEKDQIIEAKNKATTIISDSLTKKEKDAMEILDDTKEQMIKMQNEFVAMEAEWKEEKMKLSADIEAKEDQLRSLKEANAILENSRFQISLANSRLSEELESKVKEVLELQGKLSEMTKVYVKDEPVRQSEEEKGSIEIADMTELTRKIEVLEQLNFEIRQTNKELEFQLASISKEAKSPVTISPSKKASPLPTRKGRNTASKMKSPWSKLSAEALNQDPEKKTTKSDIPKSETIVQALSKDLLEKDYIISQKDTIIHELTSSNDRKEILIDELKSQLLSQKNTLSEKVDIAIETEKSDLKDTTRVDGNSEERLNAAREQIASLTEEIDSANKNMIKVKSNCKSKLKQMQKTIDKFGSVSDANAEIVRLNEEIHQLSQKVAELEEEKGNLQLHLVDYDSGRLTDTDIYKKMVEMENLAEARLKSISLLETQKFDLVQELHILQQKNSEMEDKIADISQLENEQVCSEIKSVQLEEQIDGLVAAKKELELVVENLKLDKEQVERNIDSLKTEKEELLQKLEHYVQENIDLTDKLEKLSAEKVSSAESIEIVESLTTQEKLEIEEYNKGIQSEKADDNNFESTEPPLCSENSSVAKLMQENEELKSKIELFSQERQEVMEKMSTICTENITIHKNIEDLENRCRNLQTHIDQLSFEKAELLNLNKELNSQIEELKHQRLDIVKEAAEVKLIAAEDTVDNPLEIHQDDKAVGDKASKGAKSVKQLTKEILKLKNIIKEREDDIADCQMKILSLEESQEKQSELTQSNAAYEVKVKQLSEENKYLKIQNDTMMNDKIEQTHLKDTIEPLQQEIQRLQREYSATVNSRDAKVQELEHLLGEYEKQIFNYSNTLQQKDKDINEYVNQVTKLNDVSQKLKSRIEIFEEEKANDQNVELIQSLNQQILLYQNALSECEEKLRTLEEEKAQLASIKSKLESKHVLIDSELSKLKETHNENQKLIDELKRQQQKHREEWAEVMLQAKDRDEEIHEIKLQLRKESIENEKLRTMLQQKEHEFSELMTEREELKKKLEIISHEETSKSDLAALENKNKELIEKLKKFALSIKKKTAMYSDLENQFNDMQKQLEIKSEQYEQAMIQVETVPALQDKLKYANEELNRILTEKNILENNLLGAQSELESLQKKYDDAQEKIIKLNDSLNTINMEAKLNRDENVTLNLNMESLTNKLVEYEIELKNNSNLLTKITCLESEIDQKQMQIANLTTELQSKDQNINQLQFGLDAKVQERDMYIENLQSELDKYKNRIYRLEESISVMENKRQSLERKADQLDMQLQEKQKSYSDYTVQEDELITRLAALMDHDRVLEKELHEIENDNKNLQYKIHDINEEFLKLQKKNSELQQYCSNLENQTAKVESLEAENSSFQQKIENLETNLKKLHNEHQQLLAQRKMEMDDVEAEFNTQIEAAIKEKKHLSENVEKLNEHIQRLESEIHEYRITIENLHINLEELSTQNRKLKEQSSNENPESPDYTEQYISEINRLNSIINSKNSQITEEIDKIQTLQAHNHSLKCTVENNVAQLSAKLQESFQQLQDLSQENESLKSSIRELNILITQKEDQIKQLIEKKKLVFEMNIPKTEGMTISSTIEELSGEQKSLSVLESQILSDAEINYEQINTFKKVDATNSEKPTQQSEGSVEPLIVSKKAYICSNPGDSKEVDPFNSDEGWGLGESEEIYDVTPGVTQLNQEIKQLQHNNDRLKKELDASNNKLLRAIKKLKELKNANDMLANELKISKQISNSSMLDMAIESELSSNLEMLEKKVQELTDSLNKEKKDKETLTKQNEILKNANDRLIELKEKMDNELELWKYNFKQANDKISLNQHHSEVQNEKVQISKIDSKLEEDILKLEKENDELQGLLDAVKSEKEKLSGEITTLNKEVITLRQKCLENDDRDLLKKQIEDLINTNNDLSVTSQKLHCDISASEDRYLQLVNINEDLKASVQEAENDKLDFINKYTFMETESVALKSQNQEYLKEIESLRETLEAIQLELLQEKQNLEQVRKNITLSDRNDIIEKECVRLKAQLEEVKSRNESIELEKSPKTESYHSQIIELKSKIDKLNLENDQLLSTVTELRSSVSSAMDQRGFEIAELWKQHLAQRESEFQSNEQDLRMQLNASESKYEQLLESVQSSTQDETNKILILEQVTSLQNKLQEKEIQLNNLQIKFEDVMHQLDILRSEMEDEKMIHENKLLVQQEEYEKMITDMRSESEKHDEANDAVNALQIELVATKSVNESLNQRIEELKYSYESRISELGKALQQKESEIFQKTHDYTISLADRNNEFEVVRKQLLEYERKVEDLTYEKESELAVLRLKMHENTEHYQKLRTESDEEKVKLSETLNEKITECTNLNKRIVDLNKILEEYANKAAETQLVMESQELEIVTLKDEIESMKTTLRAASTRIEKHVTFASDTKDSSDRETTMNNELLDAVPRAELDLALYMLHQRDVRCEELTMELTQLLEERDTLQLRLSDSLRSYEELKSHHGSVGLDTSIDLRQDTISELPSFSIEKESQFADVHRAQTSRSSSICETDGDKPKLQAKLTELRSVKHSRDVRLRHESEQRQLGLRLLQQDVANLPPQAREQLNQAQHTLSRDSQSTPTVLLNWLRGKSTPKVVHM